jgi:small subunit ribosomal protein S8
MNSLTIDLIIRVKNGYQAQREIINADYSKANESILNILKTEGFIKDYHVEGDAKKSISIELLYINKEPAFSDVRIFSKPGRRMYRSVKQLRPVVAGLGFDRLFKTHPWGILTFIVAGTLGSLYNVIVLIRLTRHQTNDHNNEPTEDDDNGASSRRHQRHC